MLAPVMSAPNSRKRPAPGTSPMVPMPPLQQPFSTGQPDRLFPSWTGVVDGTSFVEAGPPNVNAFTMMPSPGQYGAGAAGTGSPAPSTALARRQNSNRALVHAGPRPQFDPSAESWTTFPDDSSTYMPPSATAMDEVDDIEILEKRALLVKRDSLNKRKQIPPFVQKLSSFLDEDRNTDLIRWSEKGDSFVVLDEDEFAKTLIPELFKHNNYASFVRQLNMYGFHKRVGLSDNSMKASERKNKSPSEYSNPFFRRGHPNLLWLINKARHPSKKKSKKDEAEGDSDEDGMVEELFAGPIPGAAQVGRSPTVVNEVGPLQKKDLVEVKAQIERLKKAQVAISSVISGLRQEHMALAARHQMEHERQQNSINAILNFLANVFRKSLEEQGGTHSVQDLLSSIMPNAQVHNQPQMPQGSVVDLGDVINRQAQNMVNTMGTPKRPQRLLPPAPHHPVGKASTMSPSSTASPIPQASYHGPQMGTVTELLDTSPAETTSPAYMKEELLSNPQEGMMKIIHDTNAVGTPSMDLPSVAAKMPQTMTHDQQNKMLSIMAGQSNARSPGTNGVPTPGPAPTPGVVGSSELPISPLLASVPLPEMATYTAELDRLQSLQHNQARDINQLSSLLAPLSPSGRIPGFEDVGAGYFDNVDYNQFLDEGAFENHNFDLGFGGMGGGKGTTDGNDFNFSLDGNGTDMGAAYVPVSAAGAMAGSRGMGAYDQGQIFETGTASTAATPSEAGTEEILRNDLDSPERDTKRRRKA